MASRLLIFSSLVLCMAPATGWADDEDRPAVPASDAKSTVAPEPNRVQLTPKARKEQVETEHALYKRLRRDGRKYYRNGNYQLAIQKFKELYRLTDDSDVLYDLALTYQVLRKWDECVGYMGRFLKEAPNNPKKDRALNTQQSCEARRAGSHLLPIETDPPGADVYFDNRKTPIQGQTKFAARVQVGVKRIWLELVGYEPVIKDIEIRKDEPMVLRVVLQRRIDTGWLYVDSNVRDAQVYLDGKPLQLTPFLRPVAVSAGPHQLKVMRDGFAPFHGQPIVERFLMTRVDVPLGKSQDSSTWRSSVGWTSTVVGVLAMVGGAVATHRANQYYSDTPEFDKIVGYERLGYGLGAGLTALGGSLLLWEYFHDNLLDSERNDLYGQPMETPDPPTGARQREKTGGAR